MIVLARIRQGLKTKRVRVSARCRAHGRRGLLFPGHCIGGVDRYHQSRRRTRRRKRSAASPLPPDFHNPRRRGRCALLPTSRESPTMKRTGGCDQIEKSCTRRRALRTLPSAEFITDGRPETEELQAKVARRLRVILKLRVDHERGRPWKAESIRVSKTSQERSAADRRQPAIRRQEEGLKVDIKVKDNGDGTVDIAWTASDVTVPATSTAPTGDIGERESVTAVATTAAASTHATDQWL